MRHIHKVGDGGYELNLSHENPPSTSKEAKSRWKRFADKEKVTQYLEAEQYGLCAYSEVRPDQLSLGTHIEHLEPRQQSPLRTFDYSNLVLCALSDQDLTNTTNLTVFGGHHKLNQYDPQRFISCLKAGCDTYFIYLSTGKIEPSRLLDQTRKEQAQYTIDLLNLNSPYLVTLRKNWLDELDALIDQHIQNEQSLTDLAAIDLLPTNYKLSPFFTATRQRFGKLAEQVIAHEYPNSP